LAGTPGCGAALLGAGVVDAAIVGLSDASDGVSDADDVAAFVSPATAALAEAVLGETGAVASTKAGNDGLPAAFACAAVCFADVATASLAPPCAVALAVTAASTAIPLVACAPGVVPAVVAGSVAAEPSLGGVATAPGAAVTDELAAIAAAAMASGAALAEAEAATGTLAGATVTGIATAIAFSVVTTVAPSCGAVADGSVEATSFPDDFEAPALAVPDLPSELAVDCDGGGASVLALELTALLEGVA
jgi:hypothetical protein